MSKDKSFKDLEQQFGTIKQDSKLRVVEGLDQYPHIKETKSGIKILDTYGNLEWLLTHFSAKIRYNRMTRKRETQLPWMTVPADDTHNALLYLITEIATLNDMPIKSIDNHLNMLALSNPYHPIVECIKEKPWDGICRLDDFMLTIKTTKPEFSKKLIRTWMVAAMAAAHSVTGFMNHGVLVLHGKQGMNKTRFVQSLDPINCRAIKESAILDPSRKDTFLEFNTFWISELAEIDSVFKKSEMGRLKAFITTTSDYVRSPFARQAEDRARRSAYIATVNVDSFLSDDTGNRRCGRSR